MKDITDIGKKIVTINEISLFYKEFDYKKLINIVKELIETERIIGIKSSGSNGLNPPLYNKYRILESKVDLSYLIDEINYNFPINFNRIYYLNNLENYLSDQQYINLLIKYFRIYKDEIETCMSINERSFRIFGEEKFLKDGKGTTILKNVGLSLDDLNIYFAPEPFVYYSRSRSEGQVVLIIENKDTWYTMRKLMIMGVDTFLGVKIDTIIYGAGKNIEKALDEYSLTVEDYLQNPSKVLYWGDIDYEGILIYERLKERYIDIFLIELFKEAYFSMLQLGTKISLPKTKENQNKNIGCLFLNELKSNEFEILRLLESNYYIPQEIINYHILEGGLIDV